MFDFYASRALKVSRSATHLLIETYRNVKVQVVTHVGKA